MEHFEVFDNKVRLAIFREFVRTGEPPTSAEIAERLRTPAAAVRSSMERLATGKAIVLQPESRELLMASPLCAVPTPYRVRTRERSYFAACAWDALGVIAMLRRDATVGTSCGCCGESMGIEIRDNQAVANTGLIHFALPARRWWDDIAFT